MEQRNFMALLKARMSEGKSLCVGLDSDLTNIPPKYGADPYKALLAFNKKIVDETHGLVVAFKLNIAFYHDDHRGRNALKHTIAYIKQVAPNVPIILDYKRADIGNTNFGYIHEAFTWFEADAVTVSPYFGREALEPFLAMADKGIIILCRTSNQGAGEFQNLPIYEGMKQGRLETGSWDAYALTRPLYQIVAEHVANEWNTNGNCMLVVGATAPEELAAVRAIVGDMPLLIPGIGAQGGEVLATVKAGMDSAGNGMVINSSRGIIFTDDPRQAAIDTNTQINEAKEA